MNPSPENHFEKSGYKMFSKPITPKTVGELREEIEILRSKYNFSSGLRKLTQLSTFIKKFASSKTLHDILENIGLKNAFLVRSLLFDKTAEANWTVASHQDTKISIREQIPTEGFAAWSIKDGIVHAQPPKEVLASMRTIRIHLDDTTKENGALRVVPGSHRKGFLTQNEIERLKIDEVTCECAAGGILAMSPLLLHSSSPASNPTHRRVIHLEYANQPLPSPLKWAIA